MKPLKTGETVGVYTVQSVIADDCVSAFYEVNEPGFGHRWVLELPYEPVADDRVTRMAALHRFDHHNLVPVRGALDVQGRLGLVTGASNDPPLSRIVATGRLPLMVADRIVRGILEGAAEAHRAGATRIQPAPHRIQVGLIGGAYLPTIRPMLGLPDLATLDLATVRYLAPEVLAGADIDERADVYSLGLILYELLTGARAFPGTRVDDVRGALLQGRYTPIHEVAPDMPDRFRRAVEHALEPDPGRRITSAKALYIAWLEASPGEVLEELPDARAPGLDGRGSTSASTSPAPTRPRLSRAERFARAATPKRRRVERRRRTRKVTRSKDPGLWRLLFARVASGVLWGTGVVLAVPLVGLVLLILLFLGSPGADAARDARDRADEFTAELDQHDDELVAQLVAAGADAATLVGFHLAFQEARGSTERVVAAVSLYEESVRAHSAVRGMDDSTRGRIKRQLASVRKTKQVWERANLVWYQAVDWRGHTLIMIGGVPRPVAPGSEVVSTADREPDPNTLGR